MTRVFVTHYDVQSWRLAQRAVCRAPLGALRVDTDFEQGIGVNRCKSFSPQATRGRACARRCQGIIFMYIDITHNDHSNRSFLGFLLLKEGMLTRTNANLRITTQTSPAKYMLRRCTAREQKCRDLFSDLWRVTHRILWVRVLDVWGSTLMCGGYTYRQMHTKHTHHPRYQHAKRSRKVNAQDKVYFAWRQRH